MKNHFSTVVLVRNQHQQTEFLRCSLLDPVVSYNPPPSWTRNLDEAEQFTGERELLLAIAERYDAVPMCNFGTPEQVSLLATDRCVS